jgi:hypothetical protein
MERNNPFKFGALALDEAFTDREDELAHKGGEGQSHVFISYVREDKAMVQRLASELEQHGVEVWLDRDRLRPGMRWQAAIRRAIEDGAFFIACFSEHLAARQRSYMNEELVIAIDAVRRQPSDRGWFLPVLLSPNAAVPDRLIGAGETLHDIHYVELYGDWDDGIRRLVAVIQPRSAAAQREDLATRVSKPPEQRDPLARHSLTAAELMRRNEAQRTGIPYLVWRDGDGALQVKPLSEDRQPTSIGSSYRADIRLGPDPLLSNVHALLTCIAGEWAVVDDGMSVSGTFVNERRVWRRVPLADGDRIRVGATILAFAASPGVR